MQDIQIYQMCLRERKKQIIEYKKELDNVVFRYRKAQIEEDICYYTKDKTHSHEHLYEERRKAFERIAKELEEKKAILSDKIKALEGEIKYIEKLLS